METASSYLALMPISKDQISTFADKLINEITSGSVDPLQVAVQLKAMEEVIAAVRKNKAVQAEIIDVVARNKNKLEFAGAVIEVRSKTKYCYESDAKWAEIEQSVVLLKTQQKEREAFLKVLKAEMADPETGEIITPIRTESEEILYVSFKKEK